MTEQDPWATPPSNAANHGAMGPVEPFSAARMSPPPPVGYAQIPPPVGYAQAPPAYYGAPASTAKNWMGITALVLSIASLMGWITWIGGLIFGYMGLAAAKRGEASNRGLALAAVIIGWVGAALTVLGIAGLILYIAIAGYGATE